MKADKMSGACRKWEGRRKDYRILVGKPEGKRQFRRPRHKWEDNIKINLEERVGRVGTRSIWLRTGIFAGSFERGNKPSGFIM